MAFTDHDMNFQGISKEKLVINKNPEAYSLLVFYSAELLSFKLYGMYKSSFIHKQFWRCKLESRRTEQECVSIPNCEDLRGGTLLNRFCLLSAGNINRNQMLISGFQHYTDS